MIRLQSPPIAVIFLPRRSFYYVNESINLKNERSSRERARWDSAVGCSQASHWTHSSHRQFVEKKITLAAACLFSSRFFDFSAAWEIVLHIFSQVLWLIFIDRMMTMLVFDRSQLSTHFHVSFTILHIAVFCMHAIDERDWSGFAHTSGKCAYSFLNGKILSLPAEYPTHPDIKFQIRVDVPPRAYCTHKSSHSSSAQWQKMFFMRYFGVHYSLCSVSNKRELTASNLLRARDCSESISVHTEHSPMTALIMTLMCANWQFFAQITVAAQWLDCPARASTRHNGWGEKNDNKIALTSWLAETF